MIIGDDEGMQKKVIMLVSMITCLFLMISFSGCINQEETLDPTIQRIKDAGKLVVGTSTPYEPMEYKDETGEYAGFDIDIANEIANQLGVETDIKDMDFELLIDAVANGEVDIAIAAITITSEREEKVAFSNPYFNAGQVIITNESNQEINIPEDLEDKKVGVEKGTTNEGEALKYTNETNIIKYSNYTEAINGLEAGTIDAVIIDRPAGIVLTKDNSNIKIVGDPFTNDLYGIAIKKDESALKTEINNVIASGIIDTFETKWF